MSDKLTPSPTAAARVSGTIKADAARLADQAETLAAPLVGQHEGLRSHHLETAAALRILAAIQPDPEPKPVSQVALQPDRNISPICQPEPKPVAPSRERAVGCQPGKAGPLRWLISFYDQDVAPEHFDDEAAARLRFAHLADNWNCRLYAEDMPMSATPSSAVSLNIGNADSHSPSSAGDEAANPELAINRKLSIPDIAARRGKTPP